MAKPQGTKVIADNRRARHDYTLLERVEAGLQLAGTEVKSLRENGASLAQAHAEERGGELWLVGAHIAPYEKSGAAGHDPDRDRKLLLHRREIDRLAGRARERGLTLVPDAALLQGRAREGRDRAGPRQGATRQAPRHREARRRPPDRARAQVAQSLTATLPAQGHTGATRFRRGRFSG